MLILEINMHHNYTNAKNVIKDSFWNSKEKNMNLNVLKNQKRYKNKMSCIFVPSVEKILSRSVILSNIYK